MLRRGMDQRDALKLLMAQGFTVEHRKGTGEIILRHPSTTKPIVMRKRKDLPSEVVHLVRRIIVAA